MAIEFARVSVHSRSQGHSAVAGAAYRAGVRLVDERTGEIHDYSKRQDVAYQAIMLPDHADKQFLEREYLWNQVESAEKRKDSQVAKDVILALPKELDTAHHIELARNFAHNHFVRHGLAVDIAIHDHGDDNPHAHLYVTTRRLQGIHFDRYKARDLNPSFANWQGGRGFISEQDYWNDNWRSFQEQYFENQAIDLSVDANHLVRQHHEGRNRQGHEHYVREDNVLRRERSIELTLHSPEAVLNELGSQQGVFTDRDIDRLLTKNTNNSQEKSLALDALTQHQAFIQLGPGDDGHARYTTRDNYQLESELGEQAEVLARQKARQIPRRVVNQMAKAYGLNEGQTEALTHLAKTHGIAAIVGRAGTGKSYMMKAARELWESQGFRVQGMAVSGVAAAGLKQESGIKAHTIAYYKSLIAHDAWHLDEKSVVVMDEAGMTNLQDMAAIVRHVHQTNAQLVLIGDHAQLQPIGPGAPFRAILERVGFAEIDQILRQSHAKDRAATAHLAKGQVKEALAYYADKGAIHIERSALEAQQTLIRDWVQSLQTQSFSDQLIITYKNDDVRQLNQLARTALQEQGLLSKNEVACSTQQGTIALTVGERLLFAKNDKHLGVHNGDFGSVVSLDGDQLRVKLDRTQQTITFSSHDYQQFTHGYAATVHKTQGVTLKRSFVYVGDGLWNRALTYVALSRHKDKVDLYTNQAQYADMAALSRALGRAAVKDSVLDFPIAFATRRGLDTERLVDRFIERVADLRDRIKDKWLFVSNYEAYLQQKAHQAALANAQARRQDATLVAAFADLHRGLGKEWSHITRSLQSGLVDQTALYQDKNYAALVQQTYDKNKLAADIARQPNKYLDALALNGIDLTTIQQAAEAYTRDTAVKQFIDAYQSGHFMTQQQWASLIHRDIKAHYRALANYSAIANLPVQAVIAAVKARGLRYDYLSAKRQASTPEAKARVERVYRYATLEKDLRDRWRFIYQYDAKDVLSTDQLKQYHQAQMNADQLAAEIYSHVAGHQHEIALFQVDANRLKAAYDRHLARSTVTDYAQAAQSMVKEPLAHEILTDRRYFRYVYEQDVSWQQLYQDKKAYDYKATLRSLSAPERRALHQLRRYQDARINVGKAWSALLNTNHQQQPSTQQVAFCQSLTQTRNRLAYQMALNPAEFVPLMPDMKLRLSDIEKHAKAHRRQLQRQQARGLRKNPSVQSAFVSTPGSKASSWQYETVSQALANMGQSFYDSVLGFEGQREGARHIRYGQGHALVYAHAGDAAGSWHSFSSGEGGGPIQLLMSQHHGWGLRLPEALSEGARLAGLSPEASTVVRQQAPIIPSDAKLTSASTRDAKMSAARYYYQSAEPIQGTIGERYLREHRHITGDISDVRYHPRIRDSRYNKVTGEHRISYHPGIVIAAKNEQGQITAVQTILLDKTTANKIDAQAVGVVKRSHGVIKGSAVLVQQGTSNQVILAEGLETGKSLMQAAPAASIYVTLGNIKNAQALGWLAKKHQTNAIYFAADYDPQTNHKNLVAIREVATYYKHELGLDTYMSQPTLVAGEKCDFNDVLQQKGAATVKRQLNAWQKVIIPERETLIDEQTIENNVQQLGKLVDEARATTDIDRVIEAAAKKIVALDQEIADLRAGTPAGFIARYESLLLTRYQTKDTRGITALDKQMDLLARRVYQDKAIHRQINTLNPQVAQLIKDRAQRVLARDKDRDIER